MKVKVGHDNLAVQSQRLSDKLQRDGRIARGDAMPDAEIRFNLALELADQGPVIG
jgi:hypothetical protein